MSNILYRRQFGFHRDSHGPATIQGTTKKLTENYGNQEVYLFFQEGFRLVRQTRSAADGSYAFPSVASDTEWIVASIDRAGAYNMVAADRVKTPA